MSLYGLIIGICFVIGFNYFSAHNDLIVKKHQSIFFILLAIVSLIGARLYHVIDQWSFYSLHLALIPQTWNGGLAIYGGLIFGLIFVFVYSKITNINFLLLLNLITPILPLCQAIGRLGNYVNHEISIWWLESLLCLVLYFLIKKFSHLSASGLYFIGYGLIRFITEFFRTDTWQIDFFKVAQIISLFFVFIGIIILAKYHDQTT